MMSVGGGGPFFDEPVSNRSTGAIGRVPALLQLEPAVFGHVLIVPGGIVLTEKP
jgi:hypothetical protein